MLVKASARTSTLSGILIFGIVLSLLTAVPAPGLFGDHYEQLYLDAVKAWLDDPTEQGAAALVELESETHGPKLNRLDEAEERMANDLSRIDPQALLPIAALHRMAYELHLEAENPVGTRHSAQRMRDVVNLYAKRAANTDARAVAARQWMGLALTPALPGWPPPFAGHGLPQRSLTSYQSSPGQERRGASGADPCAAYPRHHLRAYPAPPPRLSTISETCSRIAPNHPEARLREAVNLMHAERPDESEPKLRQLVALGAPEWIPIVAAQQLARLLIDADRSEEAHRVLEGALERFPHNARLGVMLAYQERPRWQSASARVASLLEDWPKARPIRPRARYEGPVDDDAALGLITQNDLASRLDQARAAITELEARRAE